MEPNHQSPEIAELRRLIEAERQLGTELDQVRARIAHLMVQLLPAQARGSELEQSMTQVRTATGYDRRLIDALRSGRHAWRATP